MEFRFSGVVTDSGISSRPRGAARSQSAECLNWVGSRHWPLEMRPGSSSRSKSRPVRGGLPYLVGEKGPEIVVPGASGTVIPNHRLASLGAPKNESGAPSARLASLGAPKPDAPIPATMAFRAMMPKADLSAVGAPAKREPAETPPPVPNPLPMTAPAVNVEVAAASRDTGARTPAASPGRQAPISVTVNINGAQDPAAIDREVQRVIKKMSDRTGMLCD